MARQVRQIDRRSSRITKGASRENNLEKNPRDADGDKIQVENCEGDTQGERLRPEPSRDGKSRDR